MILQRIVYRWGLQDPQDPEEVEQGDVEIKLVNGRTLRVDVKQVESITIHEHLDKDSQ